MNFATKECADHEVVRSMFPIGTPLKFGPTKAIISGYKEIELSHLPCLWITITNVATGDWFNVDPFAWGIKEQILEAQNK